MALKRSYNRILKGTGSENLGAALAEDITNGTTSATSGFQTGGVLDGKVGRAADTTAVSYTSVHNSSKGQLQIPTKANIASSTYYAIRMERSDIEITESEVLNWINSKYTDSAEDKMYLANLNNNIQNGADIFNIVSAIKANQKYENSALYPVDEYDITYMSPKTIQPEYGKKVEEYDTGNTTDVLDHYEPEFHHNEYYWDTTDPDIANAIAMYAMAQRGVTVVTEEQASSYRWLANTLETGTAVLTTFDPNQVQALADLMAFDANAVNNMSDAEYEDFMGIKNTSVAVETSVMEVPDEKDLKKAEAIYEAELLKIDRKDRKYDKDLSALEAERNATKEEIETLKTVAKENVDRTFKLFS